MVFYIMTKDRHLKKRLIFKCLNHSPSIMSLTINTNTYALYAQNAISKSNVSLSSSMEQLSTGLKLNHASDNSSGIAISQSMLTEMNGLGQSVDNANDGINMLQTADAALSSISDMLQTMSTLAIQSANGTYSSSQRSYMHNQFSSLQNQINSVIKNTTWNDKGLLNGESSSTEIQIGDNSDAKMTVNLPDLSNIGANLSSSSQEFTVQALSSPWDSNLNPAYPSAQGEPPLTMSLASLNLSPGQSINLTSLGGNWALGGNDYHTGGNGVGDVHNDSSDPAYYVPGYNSGPNQTEGQIVGAFTNQGVIVGSPFVLSTQGASFNIPTGADSIQFGFNDDGYWDNKGYVNFNMSIGAGINDANSAAGAVTTISNTISLINDARSKIGSDVNSLSFSAQDNVSVQANLTISRAKITDSDYAAASTELARNQIIQQAATAMLAQANQNQGQSVLALLKGFQQ